MLLGKLFDLSTLNQSTFLPYPSIALSIAKPKGFRLSIRQGAMSNRDLDLYKPAISIDVFS